MAQELPEGTVTVLFTDLVGSTDLATSRGDEAAQEILRTQRDLTRQKVEEHSGHEVKSTGDGFMVAFASARRAVACAVEIQRALEEHNRRQAPDQQFKLRMGLNTGEAIQEEGDLYGAAVNAAARIAAKAKGGQLLVSQLVKDLVGLDADVPFADRGRFRLKGFPQRWHLFEAVWQPETLAMPALLERTPFVGREEERAELRRWLDQAAGGQGNLVLIGGEPGVGKTRLAQELMAEATQRNFLALTGRCYEMEGASPYIPFVEMLQVAARMLPKEALREALGDSAPEVAKLMPELCRLFPDIPSPLELPPAQERRLLFDGVCRFVERIARTTPLFLTLEDLHWADDATLLLLQHMAQRLHDMPLLVVGTYRDVELDAARPLARALEELLRQRLAHDVALKRLPEAGVGEMLRALSAQEPPAPLVQAIYGETEGNPFFVEEVFQHLAEEGKLFDDQGHWRSDLQVNELDVPRGVRLVIGRRLERVSEESRRVLTAAAVIGRGFSFELLEALGDPSAGSGQGMDADALLDAVDEAERAHLITSTSDGAPDGQVEDRFTFAHELIRQTLLSDVSAPRRRRLHLRVAEAMERVYARAPDEHAADLAHHLHQAGTAADPQKTVRYLTLAGERALAAVAYGEGARLYQMALQALDLEEKPDEALRCELLLALGEAQNKAGEFDKAGEEFHRAARIAREMGQAELLARAALGRGGRFLLGDVDLANDPLLVPLIEEALNALGEQDNVLRARLLALLAALIHEDSPERGASFSQEGVEMARRIGDPAALAHALAGRQEAVWRPDNLDDRFAIATEIVRLAEEVGDKEFALLAHCQRHTCLIEQGDLAAAAPDFEAHARLGEELQQHSQRMHTAQLRAMRALLAGRLEEAERLAQEGLAIGQRTDPQAAMATFSLQLFALRKEQGRLGELEASQKAFAQQYPQFPLVRAALALIYKQLDREVEARDEFERLAAKDFADLPRDWMWMACVTNLAETCAFLHDAQRAATLYELLLPYAERTVVVVYAHACYGSASRHLGLLAATMGRWEEAARHFEYAIEMNMALEARPYLAHTQEDYARMLIDRDGPGDRDKAFRLLTEAVAMYREIGMPKHMEMAEALLGEV
jgi:predicted ATPase/class 3 adenylate cyclase